MPMRWIKYVTIVLSISVGLFILATWAMFSGERPKSEFADYTEAKASGLMDRGWIPTFIPKSATDLREQHDLDTNWVKMSFNYSPGDIENNRNSCESEQAIENGIEFKCVYYASNVSIKLYNDGKAKLYSSPN